MSIEKSPEGINKMQALFTQNTAKDPRTLVWPDKPREEHSLAQGFKEEYGFYYCYIPVGNYEDSLITSNKKIIVIDPHNLADENIYLAPRYFKRREDSLTIITPQDRRRWSTDTSVPYNVKDYLDGKTVNPWNLFRQIEALIKKFVWFYREYSYYYSFLAVFSVYTYLYLLFDCCMYIALGGTKRSGKTRILEVLNQLCFNAEFTGSISGPALYRVIEIDRCTLLCDESDLKVKAGSDDPTRAVIKDGYKRSGCAIRCEGDENTPTRYSSFGPKVFANVKGFDDEIIDRCVEIVTERMPDIPLEKLEMDKLLIRKYDREFRILRNQCYIFGLGHFKEVREAYLNLEPINGITDREEEIWSGLLAVCKVIDQYRLKEEPDTKPKDLLFNKMVMMARQNREAKEIDGAEDWQKELLDCIWEYIHSENAPIPGYQNWYVARHIKEFITHNLEWTKNWTTRTIGSELKKCHVLPADDHHRTSIKIDKKAQQCYRITEEAMLRVGKKYRTSYASEINSQTSGNAMEPQDELTPSTQTSTAPIQEKHITEQTHNITTEIITIDDEQSAKFCFGGIATCVEPACDIRERCEAAGAVGQRGEG